MFMTMRFIAIFIIAIGWCTGSAAGPAGDPYAWLLAKTGVLRVLSELPADVLSAANRNASRCGNPKVEAVFSTKDLSRVVVSGLRKNPAVSLDEVRALVDWYTTFTGRKVRKLERRVVDEDALRLHIPDDDRLVEVIQIYRNTNTASFVADVAAEIEYAGWRISNCVQTAASSGDLKNLRRETMRGQLIRGEAKTIRQLFERDILLEMEYVLTGLSDKEHTEYLNITKRYSKLYFAMINSLIDSIKLQSGQINVSALP